ncbi:hypothetical protein [Streptomyces koyangensis]|uniref:Integral membrane protein n=1 Tax=Streptomyces koyangensis TaxID=188770 RepID=A0A385DI03_9ACTN|nr:hypothetical protein [Streptomyces koyangensis]AXQ57600.1 hypothetical protein D0C37_25375 [Streptomyces koyangensis]
MGAWWDRNIIDPGKQPLLLALAAFILAFGVVRGIARLIRAGKGPFHNITPGGLHIHHAVPGVLLMVAGGFCAVGSGRHGVGAGIAAVVFGIGAGLVLDEFALILHLADVYWTEQGRQSVEVVVMAAALGVLVLAGFSPLGVADVGPEEHDGRTGVIVGTLVNFCFVVLALLKGKPRMAVLGVLVPLLALVGALRLARPDSFWARRFYRDRHRTRARATLRYYRRDRRWAGPRHRLENLIGGAPDPTGSGARGRTRK